MITQDDYFTKSRERHGVNDYAGLAQSEGSTRTRHHAAVQILRKGDTVHDYGCGTGLILEAMAKHDVLPHRYVGIDRFNDLEGFLLDRASKFDIALAYVNMNGMDKTLEEHARDLRGEQFDSVALCLGVIGYGDRLQGRHDYASVLGAAKLLRALCSAHQLGFASIPLYYHGQRYEETFHRFTGAEVNQLTHMLPDMTFARLTDTEYTVSWGAR